MRQYCRYCTYLSVGDRIYCWNKGKFLKKSTAISTNKCKLFDLNPIDAFRSNDKGYTPRVKKKIAPDECAEKQMTLKEVLHENTKTQVGRSAV